MDASSSVDLHPGPLINDVLFLHSQYRALAIFNGSIDDCQLQIRRCDGGFWNHGPIPDRVLHYIRLVGFEGIYRRGFREIDHALITSLVERWRPETHTFHLPVGEATITLQDVEVLWGLRIDGKPVIGTDTQRKKHIWIEKCQSLLGFSPPSSSIEGGGIKMTCLSSALDSSLAENATDDVCMQRACIYIMMLFGGLLFSMRSGSDMPLLYLMMLEDLEAAQSYSWGSAVLAHLYRNLCDATTPQAGDIAGALVLVQLWAWERIPTIRPDRRNPVDDFRYPYGARWNAHFDNSRVTKHVLLAYRDQLTSLRYDQVY